LSFDEVGAGVFASDVRLRGLLVPVVAAKTHAVVISLHYAALLIKEVVIPLVLLES